ncbi:uncharacterized protein JCM6883_003631 [Sporobolomyces salmoneus]|uniref:uncharacterized protein n=1 Tax=Sporobolomyces salmoneus TaxID=183962 RepID=UPI0031808E3C
MKFSLALVSFVVVPLTLAFPVADSSLEPRAWNCKSPFQCRTQRLPANSRHACVQNVCTFTCNAGLQKVGQQCLAANSTSSTSTPSWSVVPSSTSISSSASSTSTTAAQPVATILPNVLASSGVTSFLAKPNTNAIASWYRASSPQDSTNGHSWCYYPYNNDTPGFAISLKTMLDNFGGDAMAARKAYCGLEAVVTNPTTGEQLTLYVADAFDDAWVLTPTSIDVMYNSFSKLFGRVTTNENDVVKNASWYFTGNRNARYAFNSVGN